MRALIAYIGVLLVILGIVLGAYMVNDPSTNTLVGASPVNPPYPAGASDATVLPFSDPGSGPIAYTVSAEYGDSNATVLVYDCGPVQNLGCTGPANNSSPLLTVHGGSGSGTFTGQAGHWYVATANEPLNVNVNVPLNPLAAVALYGSLGMVLGGVAILIVGLRMRDPLRRPAPRIAQLKRTLYFFLQS
jgi:hypothetical protein